MNASVLETRSEPLNDLGCQGIERLDEYGTLIVDYGLLQRDDAANPEIAEDSAQSVERVRDIHEHETANNRVDRRTELDVPKILRDEVHVSHALRPSPLVGERHLGRIAVYADYSTTRPHNSRRQERNVTRSRADVENVHTR